MLITYSDQLSDGRLVRIEAEYVPGEPPTWSSPGEPPEAGIRRVYDVAILRDLAEVPLCDLSPDRADLRRQLALHFPEEWRRLREECLDRCLEQLEADRAEVVDRRIDDVMDRFDLATGEERQ